MPMKKTAAKAATAPKTAPKAARRKTPAHPSSNGPCLVIPSDPAEHGPALAAAPIVAQSLVLPKAQDADTSLPAFLKRDREGRAPFMDAPVVDRPSAIVALASLIDQRSQLTATEQWMFANGVSADEIARLREAEEEICRAIRGQSETTEEGGAPRRSSTKGETFKWLIDTKTNPNREGSQRWDGFVLLRDCANLAEFYNRGGKPDFIRWALHKKWIEVS